MRSESTSALGQPRLTKPTFGLLRLTVFTLFGGVAGSGPNCTPKKRFPADKLHVWGGSGPASFASPLSNRSRQICDLPQINRGWEIDLPTQETPTSIR